jgi:hypothetical protein
MKTRGFFGDEKIAKELLFFWSSQWQIFKQRLYSEALRYGCMYFFALDNSLWNQCKQEN